MVALTRNTICHAQSKMTAGLNNQMVSVPIFIYSSTIMFALNEAKKPYYLANLEDGHLFETFERVIPPLLSITMLIGISSLVGKILFEGSPYSTFTNPTYCFSAWISRSQKKKN